MKTIAKTLMRFAQSKACMLMLLAVLAAFVFPDLAQAATEPTDSEDVEKTIASLLSIAIDFLNALLWPFLLLIGDLMDTDMILGPGMEEKLKGIWIPVRDLVNIGFVLVLLVVAFYNVLGIGGGEGDLAIKTALPKIVLGLVLVNFTFIGGKVVLDLVNVATTAAFALPELAHGDETPYDFSGVKEEFQQKVCYKSVDEATGIAISWSDETDGDEVPIYTRLFCTKADDGTYDELDGLLAAQYFTDLNSNNIGLVMAVNMGGLSSLSVLKAESIDSFSDLTVSIMFALVMYLVFATSYLVLGIVLLVRIIVLWIALALSPLAVLVYVVPQIKEWAGGGGDFSQKIIKTLLAPVIIGLTMSLGYIMIDAWDGNLALDGGGFKANEVISKEFLIEGMDDLPQFIIALASIMIVWTGVFAAASDTYASFATEAIKGFGERVRDAAMKAPTLLPTIPIGVKDGQQQTASFAALKGLADQGLRRIEYGDTVTTEMQDLANKNPIAKMLLGGEKGITADPRANADAIKKILEGSPSTLDATQMADLATRMQAIYEHHGKKTEATQMLDLKRVFANPNASRAELDAALGKLQATVEGSDEDVKKGMGSDYRLIQEGIGGVRSVTPGTPTGGAAPTGPATAPTPPVTGANPPPPAPTLNSAVTPIVTQVGALATTPGATPADRATARTAATAAITAARGTAGIDAASVATLDALDHLVAAEGAVDVYNTARAANPTDPALPGLRTAADTAIATARTSATTANHAPSTTRLAALEGTL